MQTVTLIDVHASEDWSCWSEKLRCLRISFMGPDCVDFILYFYICKFYLICPIYLEPGFDHVINLSPILLFMWWSRDNVINKIYIRKKEKRPHIFPFHNLVLILAVF